MRGLLIACAFVAIASCVVAVPHLRAGVPEDAEPHHPEPKAPKKIVCYYGSWAVYRPGDGKYDVEDIDPFLCTHLVYGFAALDNITWEIIAFDPWNDVLPQDHPDGGKGAYYRFNALRQQNPALTTILAIGGWNEGSEKYSEMAGDPSKRRIFVNSVVQFVQKYGFNGLDMDWEYPTLRGGSPEDKQNYASLIRELKQAFTAVVPNLLLTSAVSANVLKVDGAYDIQAIIENVDIINVMSYDFHGAWEQFVHHNAPVVAHPMDIGGNFTYFNVEDAIAHWVALMGPNSDRLTMGMPMYSRGFTLDDPNNVTIYASAEEGGIEGPYTRQRGVLGFNELCEIKLAQPTTFKVSWNDVIKAKYVVFEHDGVQNQWFSYDDPEALDEKIKLINKYPVGGAVMWSIETDDLHNICGLGRNSLLAHVWNQLNGGGVTPDPSGTTTTKKPTDGECTQNGINPIGTCTPDYINCWLENGQWISTIGECPQGTIVNPELQICDYPDHVPGCGKVVKKISQKSPKTRKIPRNQKRTQVKKPTAKSGKKN